MLAGHTGSKLFQNDRELGSFGPLDGLCFFEGQIQELGQPLLEWDQGFGSCRGVPSQGFGTLEADFGLLGSRHFSQRLPNDLDLATFAIFQGSLGQRPKLLDSLDGRFDYDGGYEQVPTLCDLCEPNVVFLVVGLVAAVVTYQLGDWVAFGRSDHSQGIVHERAGDADLRRERLHRHAYAREVAGHALLPLVDFILDRFAIIG